MCEDRDTSVRHFCRAALPRSPWRTAWVDRTGSQGQGMSKVWAPFLAYPWVWVSISKKVICHSGTVHHPCFSDDPESVLVEKMPSYITQCVSRAEPCPSAGGLPHSSQDTCSPAWHGQPSWGDMEAICPSRYVERALQITEK